MPRRPAMLWGYSSVGGEGNTKDLLLSMPANTTLAVVGALRWPQRSASLCPPARALRTQSSVNSGCKVCPRHSDLSPTTFPFPCASTARCLGQVDTTKTQESAIVPLTPIKTNGQDMSHHDTLNIPHRSADSMMHDEPCPDRSSRTGRNCQHEHWSLQRARAGAMASCPIGVGMP
jgi:hypothetical protein